MNISKDGLYQYPTDPMGMWLVTGTLSFAQAAIPPPVEDEREDYAKARENWRQEKAHDRLRECKPDAFLAFLQAKPGKVVACYRQEQAYGGPEEGGWWYVASERLWYKTFRTQRARNKFLRRAVVAWAGHRAWDSDMTNTDSTGEDDLQVAREIPAPYYPEFRPHYE